MTEERKEARSRLRFTLVLAGMIVLGPLLALGGAQVIRKALRPSRFHGPSRRATCKNNLRQIGLACHMYADDHDGKFPESLAQLVPNYVDNPKIYSCPSGPSRWRDFNGGLVTEESSSYEYLPGRDASLAGDFFLAYDRNVDNHSGAGFNVVFCDAHVEWWRATRLEEFNKLLDAQERVVKALGSDSDDYEEAMRNYRKVQREFEGWENG